ncbi:MAG: M42 family metallopeptidase [Gemmatimonadota bacterium]|jgi:endoglucanase|nr:endoglucanase [Gemmatimonadota bacterium]MDP6461847.1 M42 family metallopeptidase [Gemmatimonadota bacterium]MDP6529679.1 M42 family metallopeptidase [Gemmatimonadota bacterium]MDP6802466.1 M42 family metallopeptidase [Gemmatimonadota bacterium]MDP7030978.1 M42 family metallopeptidase [Gemmatimonadota bacterium]
MNLDLLSELCRVPGGPGREERIREVVSRELEPLVDHTKVDRLGNLIGVRSPRGRSAPKDPLRLMLAAHMDEISLMVTHIDDDGFLRFTTLGGFDPKTLTAQRVLVHGKKDLLGLIGSKPVHIMSDEERAKPPALKDFFIDLGLPKSKVTKLVSVGDMITREREFARIGDAVTSKSLDNRMGLFVMIEAIRKLRNHSVELIAVATTQEEVGLRGAQVVARQLNPDLGLAIDITLANDVPGAPAQDRICRFGKGAAIKIMDSSVICDPGVVGSLRGVAEKKKIAHQMEILSQGGTDTAGIQRAGHGIPAGCISIPTRYVHSHIEMCHEKDIRASVNLLSAWIPEAHRCLTGTKA